MKPCSPTSIRPISEFWRARSPASSCIWRDVGHRGQICILGSPGLKPQTFSEKIGQNPSWKIGPLRGADCSLFSHGETAEIGKLCLFWLNWRLLGQAPRLLSPRLDFHTSLRRGDVRCCQKDTMVLLYPARPKRPPQFLRCQVNLLWGKLLFFLCVVFRVVLCWVGTASGPFLENNFRPP